MLDSLYIKNFRLFKELTIEHLGRVNLIVGRNNSGKTCLLEALWIYGRNADSTVLEKIIAKRDENWDSSEFHHIYHNNDTTAPIIISPFNSSNQKLTLDINFLNPSNNLPIQKKPTQFVGTATMESQKVEDLWNQVFVTPLEEQVLKALLLFDDKIQKVGLIVKSDKNIPMIFIDNKRLPLKRLGEGMSRVFHIILALVNAKDGLLLIDEFENGLHYTIQPKVWAFIFKLAKELNIQVFVTTHSQDCVNGFHEIWESYESEGTFHRLDNDPDEGVTVMPYDCELVGYAMETDVEVR
jgi:AAA15 family ATPase/GTPase